MRNNKTYKIEIIIGILLIMFVGFAEAAPSIPNNFEINATNSTANISWDESTGIDVVYNWVLVNSTGYENITYTVRNESMVLYTHFNDGTSTDWSLYGNNGTDTNITYVSEDKYGYAVEFNGIDSYINCGNDSTLNITDAITIEAMIKLNVLPSEMPADYPGWFKHSGQFVFFWDKISATLQWKWRDNTPTWHYGLTSTTAFESNKGYHIAYVYDSNLGARGWINSIQEDYEGYTGLLNAHNDSLLIGKGDYFFNGRIYFVRIYNRTLSLVENNANYNVIAESASYDNFTGIISNLSYGEYHIIVNARDNSSYSDWSQVYNFTISPPEATPTPTPLLVSNISSKAYRNYINWTWVTNVPCMIYLDSIQVTDYEIMSSQYIAQDLQANTEYMLTIRANNSSTYEYFYDTASTQTELSLIDFSIQGIILFIFVAILPLLNTYTQERWLFKIPLLCYLFFIIIESANNYENINAFVLVFCAVMMVLYIFVDYIKEFKP